MLFDIVDAQLQLGMSIITINGATQLRDGLMDGNHSGLHASVDQSLAPDALRFRRRFLLFLRVPSLADSPASPEEVLRQLVEDHHLLHVSNGGTRPRATGANDGGSI